MSAQLVALLLVVFIGPAVVWIVAKEGVLFWQRREARRHDVDTGMGRLGQTKGRAVGVQISADPRDFVAELRARRHE